MSVAIFTGSRDLKLSQATWLRDLSGKSFDEIEKEVRVGFVGCCPSGLDRFARYYMEPVVHVIKANWDVEGRSAGPKRNSRMVKAAAALAEALGVELVCHAWPLGESRGTRDCMRKAEAAGARVVVHTKEPTT